MKMSSEFAVFLLDSCVEAHGPGRRIDAAPDDGDEQRFEDDEEEEDEDEDEDEDEEEDDADGGAEVVPNERETSLCTVRMP